MYGGTFLIHFIIHPCLLLPGIMGGRSSGREIDFVINWNGKRALFTGAPLPIVYFINGAGESAWIIHQIKATFVTWKRVKLKLFLTSFIIKIHLHVFNDHAIKASPAMKGWKITEHPAIKICSHRLYCYCFKNSLDARKNNINGRLHWVDV